MIYFNIIAQNRSGHFVGKFDHILVPLAAQIPVMRSVLEEILKISNDHSKVD